MHLAFMYKNLMLLKVKNNHPIANQYVKQIIKFKIPLMKPEKLAAKSLS
jgi:hypothetical protein